MNRWSRSCDGFSVVVVAAHLFLYVQSSDSKAADFDRVILVTGGAGFMYAALFMTVYRFCCTVVTTPGAETSNTRITHDFTSMQCECAPRSALCAVDDSVVLTLPCASTCFVVTLRLIVSASHVVMRLVKNYPRYKIVNFDKLDYCASLVNIEEIASYPNYVFVKVRAARQQL